MRRLYLQVVKLGRVIAVFALFSCRLSFAADVTKAVVIHEVDMGEGCKIRLADPYGGEAGGTVASGIGHPIGGYVAPLPIKTRFMERLGMDFNCVSSDDESIFWGDMKFDPIDGKWSTDISKIVNLKGDDRQWILRWFRTNYRVIQLKTSNAQGFAIIERTDTMFGTVPSKDNIKDQRAGPISLGYCLFHPPKAICGSGLMGYKQEGRKHDLTPYALKILQSIEFVDDAPETPEPVPPAPAP